MSLGTELASSALLFTLVFCMSATVDIKNLIAALSNRNAILLGLFLQFVVLPFLGFCVVKALDMPTAMGISLLVVTSSPGGSYSNWWCSMFNADLALSVTMTAISTLCSVVMLPLNLLLYTTTSFEADVVSNLDWGSLFISIAVVISAIALGLYMSAKVHSFTFNLMANKLGNFAGIALVVFSIVIGTIPTDDPATEQATMEAEQEISSTEKGWKFYLGVATPCFLGLVISNVLTTFAKLKKPERVTVSVECCYQNVGIATSVAITMFKGEDLAQAISVPLYYGTIEAVILGLYCIVAWKCGWTKAPAEENFCTVISKSYEVKQMMHEEITAIEVIYEERSMDQDDDLDFEQCSERGNSVEFGNDDEQDYDDENAKNGRQTQKQRTRQQKQQQRQNNMSHTTNNNSILARRSNNNDNSKHKDKKKTNVETQQPRTYNGVVYAKSYAIPEHKQRPSRNNSFVASAAQYITDSFRNSFLPPPPKGSSTRQIPIPDDRIQNVDDNKIDERQNMNISSSDVYYCSNNNDEDEEARQSAASSISVSPSSLDLNEFHDIIIEEESSMALTSSSLEESKDVVLEKVGSEFMSTSLRTDTEEQETSTTYGRKRSMSDPTHNRGNINNQEEEDTTTFQREQKVQLKRRSTSQEYFDAATSKNDKEWKQEIISTKPSNDNHEMSGTSSEASTTTDVATKETKPMPNVSKEQQQKHYHHRRSQTMTSMPIGSEGTRTTRTIKEMSSTVQRYQNTKLLHHPHVMVSPSTSTTTTTTTNVDVIINESLNTSADELHLQPHHVQVVEE